MKRLLLSLLACGTALLGCTETQTRECGQHQCTATERCDVDTALCVRDEPPVVALNTLPRLSTEPVLYVSGSVSDDVAVAALEWSLDDGASWNDVPAFGAQFTFEVNLGQLDAETVKLTVRATDSLGQQALAFDSVVVDDVAPTVALVPLAGPATGSRVDLELDVQDGSEAMASVTADFGDGHQVDAVRDGAHWRVSAALAPNLDLRQERFTVQAKDGHGLLTTATLHFAADTRGPLGDFTAPVSGALLTGRSVEAHLSATDGSAVATVTVGFEGEPQVPAVPTGSEWVAQVALPAVDHQGRPLMATLSDGVGNQTSITVGVVVDSVGPAVSISAPVGDALVGGATLDVSGVVGADAVSVSVALGVRAPVPAPLNGSTYAAQVPVPLEDFTAELLTVTAVDSAGNSNSSSTWISVDRVAPVLSTSGLLASRLYGIAELPAGGAVSFTVSLSDGDAQASASWSVGGGSPNPGTAVTVATSPTDNGVQYAVTVRAQDRAGNVASQVETFTVDRVAPVVSFTAPAAGLITGSAQVTASVSVSEPAAVSFTLASGPAVAGSGSGGTSSANLALPVVDFSAQTITAVAHDAANNVGSATRVITVDRVAPLLNVTAPTQGQKFGLAGLAGTNVALTTVATDADPQTTVEYSLDGTTWLPMGPGAAALATAATDNPRSYSVQVRSTDRAQNRTTLTRGYSVDRVAPTVVSLVPADQARNVDPVATVTFSEPVYGPTTSSEAFTLAPAAVAAGTWDASHSVFSAQLGHYTVYQLTSASLADAYGNSVAVPFARRFHTVGVAPSSGLTIATRVDRFWVTADGDGAPLVAYRDQGANVSVLRWDPVSGALPTGVLETDLRTAGVEYRVSLSANAAVQPDLTTVLTSGVTTTNGGVNYWLNAWEPGSAVGSRGALYIATPPIASGGLDGTGPSGVVNGSTYVRAPGVSVALPAPPQSMLATSTSRWASVRMTGSTLSWDEYACPMSSLGGTVCSFSTSSSPGSVATLTSQVSTAMSPDGSCFAAAYDGTGGRMLALQGRRVCGRGACSAAPVTTVPTSPGLQVAQSWLPSGGLMGAWLAQAGPGLPNVVHLGTSSTCDGAFTEIPVGPGLGAPAQFQPVQLGNKPALLYIDGSANLKVYVP